jgi:hypothetical protein
MKVALIGMILSEQLPHISGDTVNKEKTFLTHIALLKNYKGFYDLNFITTMNAHCKKILKLFHVFLA